jgi:phytoene dehydrogenase-like protein
MGARADYDAVVVGAGPNGLAAAITLARAGQRVLLLESRDTVGGGCRSAALTLPGFLHDVCSAVHPLAVTSPCFRDLPLAAHGLAWVESPAALAHPLDDGTAVILERSLEATCRTLGPDAEAYRRLISPVVRHWDELSADFLGPARWPQHPITLVLFGLRAARSGAALARGAFRGEPARALFAGMAAHSFLPLESPLTASFGLVLAAAAHRVGWPIAKGGSQQVSDALESYFRSLGGEVRTGVTVAGVDSLPPARAYLLDVTPAQVLKLAGSRLPDGYRRRLSQYRYGPGVFKMDWALSGPIPWRARECLRAVTVHLGGTLDEIAASEREVWDGHAPELPFVLLSQPSLFDPSRAPAGQQAVWAYCHVPNGSTVDMSERMEAQIERFAPGFRRLILGRSELGPADLEDYNANYVGGDIVGGAQDWRQFFARPVARVIPYATPAPGIYICSASTPPGAGVHGMCGYFAARAALHNGHCY